MKKTKSITSVTFILIGSLISTYSSIDSGVLITKALISLISIFGLILFFVGLSRLKESLDDTGKDAISKLTWAAILGIIAGFFSFIPILGLIPAGLLNLASFILQVIGLLKLKNSKTLGATGADGVNYLLVAMGIMVVAGLFNIIPFAGDSIKAVFAFIAFLIIPFGWIKIQEAVVENNLKLS